MEYRINASKTAFYLQLLSAYPEVTDAVTENDEKAFIKICEKIKIPKGYTDRVRDIIFKVEPQQWPGWL